VGGTVLAFLQDISGFGDESAHPIHVRTFIVRSLPIKSVTSARFIAE
jgi:hypothetical protein